MDRSEAADRTRQLKPGKVHERADVGRDKVSNRFPPTACGNAREGETNLRAKPGAEISPADRDTGGLTLGSAPIAYKDRGHFFALAAQMMRRILVDHARRENVAACNSA